MKAAYPIIMTQGEKYIVVFIPDFNINTQGTDYANAIEMARDAIGVMGIDMEDDGEKAPDPSPLKKVQADFSNDIVTLVDVDFQAYRRANENRSVRKNVTLPSWLNELAEQNDINFSAVLQNGLKQELHIQDRP